MAVLSATDEGVTDYAAESEGVTVQRTTLRVPRSIGDVQRVIGLEGAGSMEIP